MKKGLTLWWEVGGKIFPVVPGKLTHRSRQDLKLHFKLQHVVCNLHRHWAGQKKNSINVHLSLKSQAKTTSSSYVSHVFSLSKHPVMVVCPYIWISYNSDLLNFRLFRLFWHLLIMTSIKFLPCWPLSTTTLTHPTLGGTNVVAGRCTIGKNMKCLRHTANSGMMEST